MAALPREGFLDLSRRLRIIWLRGVRTCLCRALSNAESELGWLGWEQVDFFDEQINAEVDKVREFESTQASLMNASAELAGRKAALDQELAGEKNLHDEAQSALAAERAPIAAQFDQAETARRQKLDAVRQFERALDEIARTEKQLEARSLSFMDIESPGIDIRMAAREVSDELAQLATERNLVLADKAAAAGEASRIEPEIARLRRELQRIDTASSAARDRFAAASRRIGAETRRLESGRKKSIRHMSRLDRKKRQPYRCIGGCLADHGIAPLNQPEVLEKVFTLRARVAEIDQSLSDLHARCAATEAGLLIAFYLLLFALLFAISAAAVHFRR